MMMTITPNNDDDNDNPTFSASFSDYADDADATSNSDDADPSSVTLPQQCDNQCASTSVCDSNVSAQKEYE